MRIVITTCAALLALGAISVEAAPMPPAKAGLPEVTFSPPVELVNLSHPRR
jgi:hypothetical protein